MRAGLWPIWQALRVPLLGGAIGLAVSLLLPVRQALYVGAIATWIVLAVAIVLLRRLRRLHAEEEGYVLAARLMLERTRDLHERIRARDGFGGGSDDDTHDIRH